jgi:hypothetical protein
VFIEHLGEEPGYRDDAVLPGLGRPESQLTPNLAGGTGNLNGTAQEIESVDPKGDQLAGP